MLLVDSLIFKVGKYELLQPLLLREDLPRQYFCGFLGELPVQIYDCLQEAGQVPRLKWGGALLHEPQVAAPLVVTALSLNAFKNRSEHGVGEILVVDQECPDHPVLLRLARLVRGHCVLEIVFESNAFLEHQPLVDD